MSKLLSVVIPIYNERDSLETLISSVESVSISGIELELILIDDCSNDGTRELLNRYRKKHTVIFRSSNGGKGSAVREGFLRATGDVIVVQDADLEYDPQEYAQLLKPILRGSADVVFGSRFVGSEPHRVLYAYHYLGNKLLTLFSNLITGLTLTDMETCYKMFSRKALDSFKHDLHATRFGIEPELTARVAQHRLRVYEVGISYYGRTYEEGKKITWRDGIAGIGHIIKYNFFVR